MIVKYGGKPPLSAVSSRPSTPQTLGSFSQAQHRFTKRRSPLPSPARFIQQQGGVEAILQGAARGFYDRGEKLGINQRVRDAVDEVKKNMQNLQAPPTSQHSRKGLEVTRWSLDDGRSIPSSKNLRATMDKRNRDLGHMLEEAMSGLRSITIDTDKKEVIESVDIAIAKMQFVKVYLEDSSMALPVESLSSSATEPQTPILGKGEVETQKSSHPLETPLSSKDNITEKTSSESVSAPQEANSQTYDSLSPEVNAKPITRPVSVPTRSYLAQSSFAFMLEPDEISSFSSSPGKDASPFSAPKQRPGRDKAAFLFGDVSDTPELKSGGQRRGTADVEEGFDLPTIKGASGRR